MTQPSLPDLLSVATEAAYLGGRRTLAYFNTGVAVEMKTDDTPVTCADRESERIIRDRIRRTFPDHTVMGEEGGTEEGDPDYRWIIDPIDGTKTFIRGVPLYGVLIGVEVRREPAVGVVYLPALDEMVSAATGHGCHWNGRPAHVSEISTLEEAAVMVTSVRSTMARSDVYERLAAATKFQRTWGDCYGYVLVATGRAEAMLDAAVNPWDCAPLLPILQEAGGQFTTWAGEATIWGKDGVGTNAALHRPVLEILKSERRRDAAG
jgi:histidinol phosphatase-like enzyme (inositol monophosphatase family)